MNNIGNLTDRVLSSDKTKITGSRCTQGSSVFTFSGHSGNILYTVHTVFESSNLDGR